MAVKMLAVFSSIFVAETKIFFLYDFKASLRNVSASPRVRIAEQINGLVSM